jgi:hypothetical protein
MNYSSYLFDCGTLSHFINSVRLVTDISCVSSRPYRPSCIAQRGCRSLTQFCWIKYVAAAPLHIRKGSVRSRVRLSESAKAFISGFETVPVIPPISDGLLTLLLTTRAMFEAIASLAKSPFGVGRRVPFALTNCGASSDGHRRGLPTNPYLTAL